MPPDPAVMQFPQADLIHGGYLDLLQDERRSNEGEHDIAIQGMPASPIVPAVSPGESSLDPEGPYFLAGSVKTTSAPLPRTADSYRGLYYEDSFPSTPLTSVSASSFSGDTSASVAHSSFTSVYDPSPASTQYNLTSYPNQALLTGDSNLWPRHSHSVEHGNMSTSRITSPSASLSIPNLQSLLHAHSTPYLPISPHERDHSRMGIYSSQHPSHSFPSLLEQPASLNRHAQPFNILRRTSSNTTRVPQDASLQGLATHNWPILGVPAQGVSGVYQPQMNQASFRESLHPRHQPSNSINIYRELPPQSAPRPSPAPPIAPSGVHSGFLGTTIARDAFLVYAHRLYNNYTSTPGLTSVSHLSDPDAGTISPTQPGQLLGLLSSIQAQHPRHLPTLLLLSCVQFSIGDYAKCAEACNKILNIDPNYVEAMSNLGMVMRAKGANRDAEALWLKAIKLRPGYWDAIDNLLHLLCETQRTPTGSTQSPRYTDALALLDYVLSVFLREDGLLLVFISPIHLHRLQNLLHTSGNIRSTIHADVWAGLHDHVRALELMFRPPGSVESGVPLQLSDVILATTVIGLLTNHPPDSALLKKIADTLGVEPSAFTQRMLERGIDWLTLVQQSSSRLLDVLLQEGGGALPIVLLTPESALRIPSALFSAFSHKLPALCTRASFEDMWRPAPDVNDTDANRVTSTVLLTIAKLFQDPRQSKHSYLSSRGKRIPRSISLTIIFYYLALSLQPAASTYNNMGIIFYSIKHSSSALNVHGHRQLITGITLAELYYKKGLSIDNNHPHLLTNYASLLKDQGRTLEAIGMYQKALDAKPDFDIALANLANVIKDSGAISKSIAYYQRALLVAPRFPDVICGYVNALSAICDWRWGRGSIGNEPLVDVKLRFSFRPNKGDRVPSGWMGDMEIISKKQLIAAYSAGTGTVRALGTVESWIQVVRHAMDVEPNINQRRRWEITLNVFYTDFDRAQKAVNEVAFVIHLVESMNQVVQRRLYRDLYLTSAPRIISGPEEPRKRHYERVRLPGSLEAPTIPALLPFHCFTYALDERVHRLVAHRNALRISQLALTAPWLPETVYMPPPPPVQKFNIGYVSSDFNNHPLSHLMLSVFRLHERSRFTVFAYATSASDNSYYRRRIEEDVDFFNDVSSNSTESIVNQIVSDQIHVLVNLGGYTKGARNDIFAARPCPLQISLMGYTGTSAAGWCDYLVGDDRASPREAFGPFRMAKKRRRARVSLGLQGNPAAQEGLPINQVDPESQEGDWSLTERFLHFPHSYFVTDHRQSFREDHCHKRFSPEHIWSEEERLRYSLRKEIFPDIPEDTVIFACFSQLYKICPSAFYHWLRILQRVPGSILWLLRFPSAGEEHLMRTALAWGGTEVASRVRFTDVAPKETHIRRCRVADLALDTFQCNAHTTATDVIWSGTPLLTLPKEPFKMCSRVASSIVFATGFGKSMVVYDEQSYEDRAVALANSISYRLEENDQGRVERRGAGELMELRRNLILHRDQMPLFDTPRWTRNFEKGLEEIWKRWADSCHSPLSNLDDEGGVTITDDDPFFSEGLPS